MTASIAIGLCLPF